MSSIILEYIKGCLCFEDRTDYIEDDKQLFDRISSLFFEYFYVTKSDEYIISPKGIDIESMIHVVHELHHLSQDLSFTSCYIERNLISQIITPVLHQLALLKEGEPLILINENYKINPYYLNGNKENMFGAVFTHLSFYVDYFCKKIEIPFSGAFLSQFSENVFKDFSISYNDLLESNAHFQSLKAILDKAKMHGVFQKNPLLTKSNYFPLKISEGDVVSLDVRQVKYNGRYFNPFLLFFASTAETIWWGDIIKYFNTRFPCYSDINPGVDIEVINFLTFYSMVIETAMTLPSYDYLSNCKINYNPVIRYVYILNYVKSLSRDDIYNYSIGRFEKFFNDCANKFGWMTYDETYDTFDFKQCDNSFYNVCMTEAYKLRKKIDYHILNVILKFPKLPVFLRNEDSFKVLYSGGKIFFVDCPYKNLDDAYFREYNDWKNQELNFDEMINLQGIVLKDIGNNLCKNSLLKFLMTGNKLCCPLKSVECPLRCGLCDDIRDLDILKDCIYKFSEKHNRINKTCVLLSSLKY